MVNLDLVDKKQKQSSLSIAENNNHEVVSNPILKYPGLMINVKLTFKSHLHYAREKTAKASSYLTSVMPNIGVP